MAVDQLKSVIISLTDDEKKEFRVFTQRQRSKDQRRDLELFEIIVVVLFYLHFESLGNRSLFIA